MCIRDSKSVFTDKRLTEQIAEERLLERSRKARENGIRAGATIIAAPLEHVVHVPMDPDLVRLMQTKTLPKPKKVKEDKSGKKGKKK